MTVLAFLIMLSGVVEPAWQAGATTLTDRTASRTLDGRELLKIGDIHEMQNHLQEALPYYEHALEAFRAKKQRRGRPWHWSKSAKCSTGKKNCRRPWLW